MRRQRGGLRLRAPRPSSGPPLPHLPSNPGPHARYHRRMRACSFLAALVFTLAGVPTTDASAGALPAPGSPSGATRSVDDGKEGAPVEVERWHTHVQLRPDGSGSVTTELTLRAVDVSRVGATLELPDTLRAATASGGAFVEGTTLFLPATAADGDSFVVSSALALASGRHGADFRPACPWPVRQADLEVDHGAQWHPRTAARGGARTERSRHSVRIAWSHLSPDSGAAAAWSTWPSWWSAEQEVGALAEATVPDRVLLGRPMVEEAQGRSLAEVAAQVGRKISLEEAPLAEGAWTGSEDAARALVEGRGTAAERAAVLLAVLRATGVNAMPAAVRPSDLGPLVGGLPSPALFPEPAVVVPGARDGEPDTGLDPRALEEVGPPGLTRRLASAVALVPGRGLVQLPRASGGITGIAGTVVITAEIRVEADGDARLSAGFSATGTAEEALREALGSRAADRTTSVLAAVLAPARPGLTALDVRTSSGRDTPDTGPFQISLRAVQRDAFEVHGPYLEGQVAPILAPGLARLLPDGVRIVENLSVLSATGDRVSHAHAPEVPLSGAVLVGRRTALAAGKAELVTELIVPPRRDVSATETRSLALTREMLAGSRVRIGPPDDVALSRIRSTRYDDPARRAADRAAAFRALGRTTLGRAVLRTSWQPRPALREAVARWAGDDAATWLEVAVLAQQPSHLLEAAARALEAGAREEGIRQLEALSTDSRVGAQAGLALARAMPERADQALRQAVAVSPNDVDARLALARVRLEAGSLEDGKRRVEAVLEDRPDHALARVMAAWAASLDGASSTRVLRDVDAVLDRGAVDAAVLELAARALATAGLREDAARVALGAAMAGGQARLWDAAARALIGAGDLGGRTRGGPPRPGPGARRGQARGGGPAGAAGRPQGRRPGPGASRRCAAAGRRADRGRTGRCARAGHPCRLGAKRPRRAGVARHRSPGQPATAAGAGTPETGSG